MGVFSSLTGGFSSAWNSSFGLPQQYMFRLAKVLSDPDVDFFDEEGFGDWANVPILGMFDGDRHDVTPDEIFDMTLGKLGVENNFATNMLANIATDPLTLVTGGATAAAKAAAHSSRALRTTNRAWMQNIISKAHGDVVPDDILKRGALNVGEVEKMMGDALKRGGLPSKLRKDMAKAVQGFKDSPNLDRSMKYSDFTKKSAEREIRLSVPFLSRYTTMYRSTDYTGWMNYLAAKTPAITAGARALGSGVKNIPFVGRYFQYTGGVLAKYGRGVRLGFKSEHRMAGKELDGIAVDTEVLQRPGAHDIWARMQGKDPRQFGTIMASLMRKGYTPEQAFMKTLNARTYKSASRSGVPKAADKAGEAFEPMWKAMFGMTEEGMQGAMPQLTPANAARRMQRFLQDYEAAKVKFLDPRGHVTRELTQAGTDIRAARAEAAAADEAIGFRHGGLQSWAFEKGKGTRDLIARMFRTDAKVPELIESNNLMRQLDAAATEQIALLTADNARLLHEAAEEAGLPIETVERIERALLESTSFEEELETINRLYQLAPNSPKSRKAIENFVVRASTNMNQLLAMVRAGDAAPGLVALREQLERIVGREIRPGDDWQVLFKDLAARETFEVNQDVAKLIHGREANKTIMRTGPKAIQGKFLAELDNLTLQKELDRLRDRNKIRYTDDTGLDRHLYEQLPELEDFANRYMLTGEEVASLMERTIKRGRDLKGPPHYIHRGKLNREAWDSPRVRLSEAEQNEILALAQDYKKRKVSRSGIREDRLTPIERDQVRSIREVLEDRLKGEARHQPRLPRHQKFKENRQARTIDEMTVDLPGGSGEAIELLAKLAAISKEMGAARKGTAIWGPAQVENLVGTLRQFSRFMDDAVGSAMGSKYRKYHEMNRKVQAMILSGAESSGMLTAGMPIGYLGRVLSHEQRKIVKRIVGGDDMGRIIEEHMPQLSGVYGRTLDSMTIEDLNQMYMMMLEKGGVAGKKYADELKQVADELGVEYTNFTQSPTEILMTRLAQQNRADVSFDFFNHATKAIHESGLGVVGRVVGTVDKVGKKSYYADRLRLRSKKPLKEGTRKGQIQVETEQIGREPSGMIVRLDDGTERVIMDDLMRGSGVVGQRLGKISDDVSGEAASHAFATTVMRGGFDKDALDRGAFGRAPLSKAMYDDLMDEYVLIGNEPVVAGVFNAASKQFQSTHQFVTTLDNANFFIKKWQTVFRANFHLVNLGGLFFQMHSVGTKSSNILGGYTDAFRFLTGNNAKAIQAYDRFRPFLAEGDELTGWFQKGGPGRQYIPKTGELTRALRRIGIDFDELQMVPDKEVLDMLGLDGGDNLFFQAGGQQYHIGEILKAMAEGGLFSTFLREGLRGSSRVSESLARIRMAAADPSRLTSKYAKAMAALDNGTEASEIFARTAGVFAQLRQGSTLQDAVANTKLATVDYAQATDFEKTFLKRGFLYYLFPRHYLPQAWKHFSQDPAAMARHAHFIRSNFVDEDDSGKVSMTLGKKKINIERLNPNIEALQLLHSAQQLFTDEFGLGTLGDTVQRREGIINPMGRENTPFQIGGSLELLADVFMANNETSMIDDATEMFWPTRFAMDAITGGARDPLGETGFWTKFFDSVILPTSTDRPLMHQKMVESGFRRAQSAILKKIQTTKNPEIRMALEEELSMMAEYYSAELQK